MFIMGFLDSMGITFVVVVVVSIIIFIALCVAINKLHKAPPPDSKPVAQNFDKKEPPQE